MIDSISKLRDGYTAGAFSPRDVIEELLQRLAASRHEAVWITRVNDDALRQRVMELEERKSEIDRLPLYGVPFAVKDNIDVAGMPTTAACPAFAHVPERSATAVQKLLEAGAILVGKTNMDQFATGLVGVRSPHGAPRCVYHHDYISGGSSSGSAVAVAAGLVLFSLGTDTAGSGRVPAAFNGIVGLKPTRGRISTVGVLPACRSLDCVSIFAHSSADALAILRVVEGFDLVDPYSRSGRDATIAKPTFRFGVPRVNQLQFFGDAQSAGLYESALQRLTAIGGECTEIDFEPFRAAAELLYGGPWVAERDVAVGEFLRKNGNASHPIVRTIILGAAQYSASDTFRAMDRLQALRQKSLPTWDAVDVLALPTTGTIYRVDEVLAEPFVLSTQLGYYTNAFNLLDLCGVAVPAGFRTNGTPFGVTLASRAWCDAAVCDLGARYEHEYRAAVSPTLFVTRPETHAIRLAVVGAHLSGQPLNHQLTSRGGTLVKATRTAPAYHLYALAGTKPPKPGLVHVGDGGSSIELEVWELEIAAFGSFTAEVPPPLAIGTVELEDGTTVKGFVCEPRATAGATDITHFGGWRAFRASK